MSKTIRRIVTGLNPAGQSVVIKDGPSPLQFDVLSVHWTEVWKTHGAPAKLASTDDPGRNDLALEPPRHGTIIRFVEFMPAQGPPPDPAMVGRMVAEAFSSFGAAHALVPGGRHPMMHRTKTIDYGILISGQITLILDEGEVTLQPADVVIQRGTAHSWENRGTMPALMAFVLVDAE
jgi:quercetin dioxygenase-like cupin family protein